MEVAKRAGFRHQVSGTALASDDGILESAVASIRRTGGHLSSEPHQIMYEGASPHFHGQEIVMGHSHIQRGGFARNMQNSRENLISVLRRQCSGFVSDELRERSDLFIDEWLALHVFSEYVSPLYEFHVEKRASTYLIPQYRDYSTNAVMYLPMISNDFVSICDGLTVFDRVSERVIFKAANSLAPHLMAVPLADSQWRFDASGIGSLSPETYKQRASSIQVDNSERRPIARTFNSMTPRSITETCTFIKEHCPDSVMNLLSSEAKEILESVSSEHDFRELQKNRGRVFAQTFGKFVWRIFAVVAWIDRSWLR